MKITYEVILNDSLDCRGCPCLHDDGMMSGCTGVMECSIGMPGPIVIIKPVKGSPINSVTYTRPQKCIDLFGE